MVGLESVPATVRELTAQQALEIALVENLQREDLNPVEETEGILHLLSVQLGIEVKRFPHCFTGCSTKLKDGLPKTFWAVWKDKPFKTFFKR
jgi:ParB family chromosome partitioning protein